MLTVALGGATARRAGRLRLAWRRSTREEHLHGRADAFTAFDARTTTGLFGEAEHLGQAEPRALADFLGGEKRLERLAQHGFAHAGPGVGDRQHHILTGARVFGALRRLVDHHVACTQRQPAAISHCVAGVDCQIEDDHLDLGRVHQGMPDVRLGVRLDADAATQGALEQAEQVDQGVVEVDGGGCQLLAPGEGQQLAGQGGAALARLADVLQATQAALQRRAVLQVVLQEAGAGEDHGQQVVEVVGDAGGQLADGFQALHLLQCGLDTFALLDLRAQLAVGIG